MPKIDGTTKDPYQGIDTTMRVLAIDPGDVHVGMAEFEEGRCVQAWEERPAQALFHAQQALLDDRIDALVIEEFRLYPWKAQQQAFSQMKTAELIGGFKLLWASSGTIDFTGEYPRVVWFQQGATIKKPTDRILRARGIVMLADEHKTGGHARDAELHGFHFLFNDPTKKVSNIDE